MINDMNTLIDLYMQKIWQEQNVKVKTLKYNKGKMKIAFSDETLYRIEKKSDIFAVPVALRENVRGIFGAVCQIATELENDDDVNLELSEDVKYFHPKQKS